MKKVSPLVLVLLFAVIGAIAQTNTLRAFHLKTLGKNDILLSGWKMHTGDNSKWAQAGLDDSRWTFGDPGTDISQFRQLQKAGIAWFRLHIIVDSALTRQQLTAWVSQYSASEVYLDGKLIAQYGTISHDPAKTIAVTPNRKLFNLPLSAGVMHTIAVRVGYQKGLFYTSTEFTPLPAFSMCVNGYKAALANYRDASDLSQELVIMNSVATGIFLILFFVHLLYFIFDRSQMFNLYYLVYCFSTFIIYINNIFIVYQNRAESDSTQMWVFFWGGIFFCVAFLFFVLVIYDLFAYSRRRVFKILLVCSVLTQLTYCLGDRVNGISVSIIFPVLCMLEAGRICIWAFRQGKKDALAIFLAVAVFTVAYTWGGLLDQTTLLSNILNYCVFFALPLGMSVYLGIKTAATNRALKTTLAKVQTLSAKSLAQEHEKQLLLANQNALLEQQVEERTAELQQSLTILKSTQNQLVQKEKMASLGELTAGIAHEIQNPLNFVNNFSEVSIELLQELVEEEEAGNKGDVIAIAGNLAQNLQKINHHGKRADSIVKGMLEHSRVGTGEKQLTDLNALADEFMRLAYHGLRSKDKSFNAELITHFDETLPKLNMVQQDIGRVLLNLFNNAFYAVNEKRKTAGPGYKPEISITTSTPPSGGRGVIAIVRDNGNGIPEAIKDKIMQPFFTTKPTGEGTGLGLSLSYDIVVKGHGGSINILSKEHEGSEFIITLPI